MLRTLFGLGEENTLARLLLLSEFLSPREMNDFFESEKWESALGEAPQRVIKRFLDTEMLTSVDLAGRLRYRYNRSELKAMARQRGLPVSGHREDLIERLVRTYPEGMKKAVRGLAVLQCSERGRAIAEQYLAREGEKRAMAERQVVDALEQRKFEEASMLVASFERGQTFPRERNGNWRDYDPASDIEMLEVMFADRPDVLAHLDNEQLGQLRVAAGMMCLWGMNSTRDWLPAGFRTGLAIDNDVAARMIIFMHHIEAGKLNIAEQPEGWFAGR